MPLHRLSDKTLTYEFSSLSSQLSSSASGNQQLPRILQRERHLQGISHQRDGDPHFPADWQERISTDWWLVLYFQ